MCLWHQFPFRSTVGTTTLGLEQISVVVSSNTRLDSCCLLPFTDACIYLLLPAVAFSYPLLLPIAARCSLHSTTAVRCCVLLLPDVA